MIGVFYFSSRDFPSNIAGSISLLLFIVVSVLFSGILLAVFRVGSYRLPKKRKIYNRYSVYLSTPYIMILLFIGLRIGISSYINRYQEDSTQFHFDQLNISDATQLEIQTTSTQIISIHKITLSESLYPFSQSKLDQPLIFLRNDISVIPLEVQYFFGREDRKVRCVLYNWTSHRLFCDTPDLSNKGMRNKYKSIVKNLSSRLGSPKILNTNLENDPEVQFKSSWEKDKLSATLAMYINQKSIRCTIHWNE